jgi:uroporphyrinogen decarboxylase
MTLRENFLAALQYKNPEHVPYEIGVPWEYLKEQYTEEQLRPLREAADRVPKYVHTIMPGKAADWKPTVELPEGYLESEWGARGRIRLPYITYSPLAEGWHLLDSYKFPDPYAKGRFDGLKESANANRDKYVRAWAFSALWEHIWMVRGYENSLTDIYTYPKEFACLRDKIVEYQIGIMEQIHEIGVDGIHFTDDWGTQRSLMIRPEDWRKLFKSAYARIFEAAGKNGTHLWFHSDGNIRDVIPDLIEIGVTVLNPIQPGPLNIDELVKMFGRQLRYSGGVDVQGVLPFGTPEDIEKVVRHWVDLSHRLGGGMFIAATNLITPETPIPNILAFMEACEKYC